MDNYFINLLNDNNVNNGNQNSQQPSQNSQQNNPNFSQYIPNQILQIQFNSQNNPNPFILHHQQFAHESYRLTSPIMQRQNNWVSNNPISPTFLIRL